MLPQPKLKPVPWKDRYGLIGEYSFTCNVDGKDVTTVVPKDFLYDGASIPAIGWVATFTPFHPRVMAPALVHDYRYAHRLGDRKGADSIFHHMLIENGVDKATAEIMFQAVRIGGGSHW